MRGGEGGGEGEGKGKGRRPCNVIVCQSKDREGGDRGGAEGGGVPSILCCSVTQLRASMHSMTTPNVLCCVVL